MNDTLEKLSAILEDRKGADPDTSYVARLHARGLNKILEKVGEEAVETILAARDAQADGDSAALVAETADLWFHSLVMLSHLGEDAGAVMRELEQRFDMSGLEEKAGRQQQQ